MLGIYFSMIIGGILIAMLIKFILTVVISTIILKLNAPKVTGQAISGGSALSVVVLPSVYYAVAGIISEVVFTLSAKMLFSGMTKMFLVEYASTVALIVAIIVFYMGIKSKLSKSNLDPSKATALADTTVKYYVLIMILIGLLMAML